MLVPALSVAQSASQVQVTVQKVPTSDPTLVCYSASYTQYAYALGHWFRIGYTTGSGKFYFTNGQCTSITDLSSYGLTLQGLYYGYRKLQLIHYTQLQGTKGHLYAEGHFKIPGTTWNEYSWVDIVVNSNGAITYSSGYGEQYPGN